uniref:Uncharacterized protein n=1 Tax=Romanomermis culicivorax TaxID=13658 RepID=A0A915HL35_ROMCU
MMIVDHKQRQEKAESIVEESELSKLPSSPTRKDFGH